MRTFAQPASGPDEIATGLHQVVTHNSEIGGLRTLKDTPAEYSHALYDDELDASADANARTNGSVFRDFNGVLRARCCMFY